MEDTIISLIQQQMQDHMNTALNRFDNISKNVQSSQTELKSDIKTTRSELKETIKELRIEVNSILEKSEKRYTETAEKLNKKIDNHTHDAFISAKFYIRILHAVLALQAILDMYILAHIHPSLEKFFSFLKR